MSPRVLKTNIENALESLRANRLQTFLTMLGVMIGISSVVIIFSLSGGVSSMISNQIMFRKLKMFQLLLHLLIFQLNLKVTVKKNTRICWQQAQILTKLRV